MTTLRATIKGRVQMVGFRIFVLDAAHKLGLRGYVRNTQGGDVYVVASGERSTLDELLSLLQRGPSAARVSEVQHEWLEGEPEALASSFEVRS